MDTNEQLGWEKIDAEDVPQDLQPDTIDMELYSPSTNAYYKRGTDGQWLRMPAGKEVPPAIGPK